MKSELINIQKHSLALLTFAFFNSTMLIFAFSYTYFHGFIYAGENALIRMIILILPHIVLLILNFWLIAFLTQKLRLNKIFSELMKYIAIVVFLIPFIILILDVHIAYAYKGFL